MKTLKQKYAPLFRALGEGLREKRWYEANSVPWFSFGWGDNEVRPDLSQDWRLPFSRMVLVLNFGAFETTIYIEQDAEGEWHGVYIDPGKEALVFFGKYAHRNPRELAEPERTESAVLSGIATFCRALLDAQTHVAAVRPVNAMKTLEWCKSQEHYVLLRSDHPANDARHRNGANVIVDEAEVLKRMAHFVRSHPRTFKHARYKKKLGQTIWIKEQWRGPKVIG